jgi:uncharacterized alpha-E superfamily protein
MTARLLTTRALAGSAGPSWTTLLRSCGCARGLPADVYRGAASDERAAGFLLTDRLFPRSIVFALNQAEACLANLEGTSDRAAVDDARRHIGYVRTNLEYRPLIEVLDALPKEMERVAARLLRGLGRDPRAVLPERVLDEMGG